MNRVASSLALLDGTIVSIRDLLPEDSARLGRFVEGLSEYTIDSRFMTSAISRQTIMRELGCRAGARSLVAVKDERILGVASYCRCDAESAEVALTILDGFQGKGLGTGLIERLALAANREGISVLEAIVDRCNTRMIELVRTLGYPMSERLEPEVIRMRFPTSIDPVSIAEFRDRWAFATK